MKTVYFDANFFYKATNFNDRENNTEFQKDLDKFLKKTEEHKIRIFLNPINIIEVASHLINSKHDRFPSYQKVFVKMFELCKSNIFESPNKVLANKLNILRKERETADIDKLINLIISAKSYDQLVNEGQFTIRNGSVINTKYSDGSIHEYRLNKENNWIEATENLVIKLKQNIDKSGLFKNNHEKKSELIASFESYVYKRMFVDACYCIASGLTSESVLGKTPDHIIDEIISMLSAFFSANNILIQKCMKPQGYKLEKHKNDLNDMYYLLYLCLGEDYYFVTYDSGIKTSIIGCSQESQVTTIEELLDNEEFWK